MDSASRLCRLCARFRHDLVGVFSAKGRSERILEKIHTHLPIQITAEDCMPTKVCEECCLSLQVSHNLLKLCLEADLKLRKILELPEDSSHLAALSQLRESMDFSCAINPTDEGNDGKQLKDCESNLNTSEEINNIESGQWAGSLESEGDSCIQTVFDCQLCSKRFSSSELLVQHRKENHESGEQFSCAICGECMQNIDAYVSHLCVHFKEDDGTVWECGSCGFNILSEEALKMHMTEACKVKPQPCKASNLSSPSYSSDTECTEKTSLLKFPEESAENQKKRKLNLHMKSNDPQSENIKKPSMKGKRGVTCRVCGKVFDSFWYMARHRNEDHSKEEVVAALRLQGLEREKFECTLCGKLLASRFSFKHHIQNHEGMRNHHCPHCSRSFLYLAQLKSHIMLLHTSSAHICPVCSKQYPNAFALRVHVRTHTGEKPFPCEFCPKAFHSRANYEQHIIIHSDKRKFECNMCPYRARRLDALQSHIRVHTNERPYTCKICGRGFKQKHDCTKHERLHAKRPPGAPIRPGGARCAQSKSENSSAVDEMIADDPNPLSDLLEDGCEDNKSVAEALNLNQSVGKPTTVMSPSKKTIPTPKVQQLMVAFEEASNQCPVYWNAS